MKFLEDFNIPNIILYLVIWKLIGASEVPTVSNYTDNQSSLNPFPPIFDFYMFYVWKYVFIVGA